MIQVSWLQNPAELTISVFAHICDEKVKFWMLTKVEASLDVRQNQISSF